MCVLPAKKTPHVICVPRPPRYGCDRYGYFNLHGDPVLSLDAPCEAPHASGWIAVLYFGPLVVLGGFVLPTVLIGIVSIAFDGAKTRCEFDLQQRAQVRARRAGPRPPPPSARKKKRMKSSASRAGVWCGLMCARRVRLRAPPFCVRLRLHPRPRLHLRLCPRLRHHRRPRLRLRLRHEIVRAALPGMIDFRGLARARASPQVALVVDRCREWYVARPAALAARVATVSALFSQLDADNRGSLDVYELRPFLTCDGGHAAVTCVHLRRSERVFVEVVRYDRRTGDLVRCGTARRHLQR